MCPAATPGRSAVITAGLVPRRFRVRILCRSYPNFISSLFEVRISQMFRCDQNRTLNKYQWGGAFVCVVTAFRTCTLSCFVSSQLSLYFWLTDWMFFLLIWFLNSLSVVTQQVFLLLFLWFELNTFCITCCFEYLHRLFKHPGNMIFFENISGWLLTRRLLGWVVFLKG